MNRNPKRTGNRDGIVDLNGGSMPHENDADTNSAQTSVGSRQPANTSLKQQRMAAWHPILHPVWVIWTLIVIAAICIPSGWKLRQVSNSVVEYIMEYDAYEGLEFRDCEIDTPNQGKNCTLVIEVKENMTAPVLIYYKIDNFHQNHLDYVVSRDDKQLLGSLDQDALSAANCEPLNKLGNITLNPCGLMANTFFNDVIKFVPTDDQRNAGMEMIEEGIAWQSDLIYKFRQPDGFNYQKCDCDDCECSSPEWTCKERWQDPKTGICYRYFYPNDNTTQYLYETYDMINPILGVTDEHFVVWMRNAAFVNFRKLYGYIEKDIMAGEVLTFSITANWDVKSFKGAKSLLVTTTSAFGGKNIQLGDCFMGVGVICLVAGVFFGLKHMIKPRKLADEKYLRYKED